MPEANPADVVHPIPCAVFIQSLAGTADEVWSLLIKQLHGTENHTPAEWKALLDGLRNQPV